MSGVLSSIFVAFALRVVAATKPVMVGIFIVSFCNFNDVTIFLTNSLILGIFLSISFSISFSNSYF